MKKEIDRKIYTSVGIDVRFKRLFEPKHNESDKLPFYKFAGFREYVQGICDAGLITNEECEFLDKCAGVAYEIIK